MVRAAAGRDHESGGPAPREGRRDPLQGRAAGLDEPGGQGGLLANLVAETAHDWNVSERHGGRGVRQVFATLYRFLTHLDKDPPYFLGISLRMLNLSRVGVDMRRVLVSLALAAC